jgi:hypothetical protein
MALAGVPEPDPPLEPLPGFEPLPELPPVPLSFPELPEPEEPDPPPVTAGPGADPSRPPQPPMSRGRSANERIPAIRGEFMRFELKQHLSGAFTSSRVPLMESRQFAPAAERAELSKGFHASVGEGD